MLEKVCAGASVCFSQRRVSCVGAQHLSDGNKNANENSEMGCLQNISTGEKWFVGVGKQPAKVGVQRSVTQLVGLPYRGYMQ